MNLSIKEKVYGAIFGYAIGDALGLGAEFMTRQEFKKRYPEGLRHYSQIVRDAHRSQWKRGEWTNDTEIILMLLESIAETKTIDCIDFASRLKKWYLSNPTDITHNLRWVLSQEDFTRNPFESTKRVWEKMKSFDSTSECIGRALFTGMWNDNYERHAIDMCRLTHPQSRCETSCLVMATMSHSLFWNNEESSYDDLMALAKRNNQDVVRYIEIARHGSLNDFKLDDEETFWFVRKAMGAALWCLWHCDSPYEAMYAVIDQGGDADTNAALATGLLGLKFGFSALEASGPKGIINPERLRRTADALIEVLSERANAESN